MYRLNLEISRYLINQHGLQARELKELGYLLVTYAIEVRAEMLYPLYQTLLDEARAPVSVISIIREEKQHLAEMVHELKKTRAMEWTGDVCDLEQSLFEQWRERIISSLPLIAERI